MIACSMIYRIVIDKHTDDKRFTILFLKIEFIQYENNTK